MKWKLNLVATLRERVIIIYQEVHLHLYTLMKCHQCNRTTCVCCKYHHSVYMTFPIYCNSLGVSFLAIYSFILHTNVRIIKCYDCLKTVTTQQVSNQNKQQQAVFWCLLSSKKGFKIIGFVTWLRCIDVIRKYSLKHSGLMPALHLLPQSLHLCSPSCHVCSSHLLILVVIVVKLSLFVGHCLNWWLCIQVKYAF